LPVRCKGSAARLITMRSKRQRSGRENKNFMQTIEPHGGVLINRILKGPKAEAAQEHARDLTTVRLDDRQWCDLEMIAMGAYSPLTGFIGRADYRSIIETMHLSSGLPWTIPITLAVSQELADQLVEGQEIALIGKDGTPVALMSLEEKYLLDKEEEALSVYGTDDPNHPSVAALHRMGEVALGGDIWLFHRRQYTDFLQYRLDPAQTRAEFAKRGWQTVVGFQTRNPVHRAHEYLQKCALEIVDGLLLNPIVGATKADDVPADVRMRCYEVILENYYPRDRVLLAVLPTAMRYAGPKEAIFHAIMRKNFGCTHFIVGRDHAGVGDYYGTYDAQYIFNEFEPGELGIVPLKFEHAFYCIRCGCMATSKTCPHGKKEHVFFSGTRIRAMLRKGELPPSEFTRPEVAKVLVEGMAKPSKQH